MFRRNRRSDEPVNPAFLGALESEFDSMGQLAPAYQAIADEHRALVDAYHAGTLSPTDAATRLSEMRITDADGAEWTIGATSGNWYRRMFDGDWEPATPPAENAGAAGSWEIQPYLPGADHGASVPVTLEAPAGPGGARAVAWVDTSGAPVAGTSNGDGSAWGGVLSWDDEIIFDDDDPGTDVPQTDLDTTAGIDVGRTEPQDVDEFDAVTAWQPADHSPASGDVTVEQADDDASPSVPVIHAPTGVDLGAWGDIVEQAVPAADTAAAGSVEAAAPGDDAWAEIASVDEAPVEPAGADQTADDDAFGLDESEVWRPSS